MARASCSWSFIAPKSIRHIVSLVKLLIAIKVFAKAIKVYMRL